MSFYLLDNPPRRSQYRKRRRSKPTGTIVLHTAENAPDLVPPDLGAENIARFIRNRSDAGSYHTINDQDSTIRLIPFEYEAFGDGTGSNPWAIQLSIAMRASQWWNLEDQQKLWYMAGLATGAREASAWMTDVYGIKVPVRRLTKASATEPGFCSHQDRETWFGTPGRRTDPWRNDQELWHLFLTLYEDTAPNFIRSTEDEMYVELILAAYRRTRGKTYDPRIDDAGGWRHWMEKLAAADVHHGTAKAKLEVVRTCESLLARESGL